MRIVLITTLISAFTMINTYAWEVLDTNGDGVDDTIQFCDGYQAPIEEYYEYKVSAYECTYWLSKNRLDYIDEKCRETPGYLEKQKDLLEKNKKIEIEKRKYYKLIDDIEKEIVRNAINDSMNYSEKIISILNYIKSNYPIDEGLDDYKYDPDDARPREYMFLSHSRNFNKKDYSDIIYSLVLNRLSNFEIINRHIDGFVTYSEDGIAKINPIGDHYHEGHMKVGNKVIYLIDDNWFEFDYENLVFNQGLSKSSINFICNWSDSDVIQYAHGVIDEKFWKNLPEEVKQKRREAGNHIPYED